MAAAGPVQELPEELTCPICLEYFRDPVVLTKCGHNFCRACLAQSWREAAAAKPSCPQCRGRARRRNLKPNRQLANAVEIAKKLSLQGGSEEAAKAVERPRRVCGKHQEPLELFCREDRDLICAVCEESAEHEGHWEIPVEDAVEEYKNKLHRYIEIQRKEKEKILICKAESERQSQDMLERTELARKKSVAEFRKLHQFLEEQEQLLLAQMAEKEQEIARDRDKQLARLCRELSSLESLIHEMQEKIQQPDSEFLQDVESILKRYEEKEEFENSVASTPEVVRRTNNLWDIDSFLETIMKKFKGNLASQIQQQTANVTLDPDTADPCLILSEDRKSVRWAEKAQQLPDSPKRFSRLGVVLGREGFTTGQHFWEVTLGGEGMWAVGVARKSVGRKRITCFIPEEGIWALQNEGDGYLVLGARDTYYFSLNGKLRRIQVALNYDEQRVSFFNSETAALLYRFSSASFHGETLFPFRVLGESYLSLS